VEWEQYAECREGLEGRLPRESPSLSHLMRNRGVPRQAWTPSVSAGTDAAFKICKCYALQPE